MLVNEVEDCLCESKLFDELETTNKDESVLLTQNWLQSHHGLKILKDTKNIFTQTHSKMITQSKQLLN